MATEDLIDERVSLKQVEKAVDALHAHESKRQQQQEETELLTGKEPNIWLNVAVKQVAPKNKIKPIKIPIVHPLVDPRTTSICLITKDPQREYKDLLESHNIKFISRIVGIAKLKGKYKSFEARRLLLKENGLFLADDRVIPLLPKLLGSKWFEAKKQPIPVSLTRKDLKGELERAVSSTYMNQNNGSCTSIKIGILSHKPSQIVANIQKAIPAIASHIPGGWDNIQNFFIKTNTSTSLPIWSCDLGTGEDGRWNGLVKNSGEEDDKEGKLGKKKNSKKGAQKESAKTKKRPTMDADDAESDEDVEAQPKKKAKSEKTPTASTASTSPKVSAKPKAASSPSDAKLKKPQSPNVSASTSAVLADQSSEQGVPKDKASSVVSAKAKPPAKNKEGVKLKKPHMSGSTMSGKTDQKSEGRTLSREEMKKKRAGVSALQKKKQVVLSGDRLNGAKAKVLGRKAMQS